jgi:tetratricopeptide (TPR) repeat protein
MRKERRHELKENELAEILAKWYSQIAPHSQKILIGILAVLIVYLGWSIWSRWAEAVENEAWEALHAAVESGAAADYEAVAERFPRTDAAHWAQLMAADTHLQIGCRQILTNKADGTQELRKALDGYLALRNVQISPFFQERVLWGLGRTYEALSGTREGQGELDRAIAAYRELVERWPDGPFSGVAKRRLSLLEKPETREFYDALAAYEPAKQGIQPPTGEIEFGPASMPSPPEQQKPDENAAGPVGTDAPSNGQPNAEPRQQATSSGQDMKGSGGNLPVKEDQNQDSQESSESAKANSN